MIEDTQIRLLIADDSFFIRHYLTQLFANERGIELVGVAGDGEEVVALSRTLKPDVITMDYNMPKKNGIEASAEIMLGERPLPSIIMLSAFDGEDGERIRRALFASGAQLIVKPSGEISLDIEKASQEILQKVLQVGRAQVRMRNMFHDVHKTSTISEISSKTSENNIARQSSLIVVIGASTGGPPLIESLLSVFDNQLGVSIVIVQHMSKYFTELFAERLNRVTNFHVREAKDGDVPMPGTAIVVPGGMYLKEDMEVDGTLSGTFSVIKNTSSHEIEIDMTMQAIANVYGKHVCGILLSGMGTDGGKGVSTIKTKGGYVIIQDPEDSSVSAMPKNALHTTSVDQVLRIELIPDALQKLV